MKEIPNLENIYNKYNHKNFKLISISLDEKLATLEKFRKKKYAMPWLNAYIGNSLESKIVKDLNITDVHLRF